MNSTSFYDMAWSRLLAYGVALVVPPLLAYNLTPSPTLFNELLAVCGWGGCLLMLPGTNPAGGRRHAVLVLCGALALMAAAVVASWTLGSLPTSLALPPLSLLLLACAIAALGARVAQSVETDGLQAFAPFAVGMVLAGLLSTGVAIFQVFWPDAPDGDIIARSGLAGRAVGNLRQPNHLASLLIWSVIALVPLVEWRRVPRWLGSGVGVLLILGVILSGSRTGLYGGVWVLVLWGALDKHLSRSTRIMLVSSLPAAVLLWFGLDKYLAMQHHVFGAAARLSEGDSSHFAIWKNTVALILQQPWLGVGWGEFNFAWTLTSFPHRPTAFFDHSHDLPLQLAAELGLPGALLVLGLLVWALVQGWQRAWSTQGDPGHGARAAWVMIAMIALHSLDEYPLWYAYFLLPAAWAWGFTLGSGPAPAPAFVAPVTLSGTLDFHAQRNGKPIRLGNDSTALRWIGAVMIVASALAAWDYRRVSTIFSDESGLPSLSERIATGERSLLFAHHADYADATTTEPPSHALGALARATHSLLDTRLMIAWAKALDESGQHERARYLVARLREFSKEDAEEFFAPCEDASVTDKPFQCLPEPSGLTWRDFR